MVQPAGKPLTVTISDEASQDGGAFDGISLQITAAPALASNVSWYAAPTGGTAVSTNPSFDPVMDGGQSTAILGTYTYYAECKTAAGCASARTAVELVVKAKGISDTSVTICNTYIWNGTTYKSSGDYQFSTISTNGCDSVANLHLTITSLNSTFVKTDAGCFGSATGSITITPTDGDGPYTYRIGTSGSFTTVPSTSYTFNNLKAGKYRITIVDSKGCQGISNQVTIGQQVAPTGTIAATNPTCYSSKDGSITATPSNSSGPYQYRLGTVGSFGSNNTFTGLKGGTYRVYIQDGAGCVGILSATTLVAPTAVSASITKTDESCPTAKDGVITVTGTGGTSPYQYNFGTVGNYATNNIFNGLKAGTYRIFVRDANNCTGYSIGVVINQRAPSCTTTFVRGIGNMKQEKKPSLRVTVLPNPSGNQFTLVAHSTNTKPINIRVMDAVGKMIYTAKGNVEQPFRFGESFANGLYIIEVRQGDEVKIVKAVKGK